MTYTLRCGDCQAILASYDSESEESKQKANEASLRHSCREQRKANRAAQRREKQS